MGEHVNTVVVVCKELRAAVHARNTKDRIPGEEVSFRDAPQLRQRVASIACTGFGVLGTLRRDARLCWARSDAADGDDCCIATASCSTATASRTATSAAAGLACVIGCGV